MTAIIDFSSNYIKQMLQTEMDAISLTLINNNFTVYLHYKDAVKCKYIQAAVCYDVFDNKVWQLWDIYTELPGLGR